MAISFNVMRRIDHYAGALGLTLLRLVFVVLDRLRPPRPRIGTILVQKYLGIGSIINAIPLMTVLRREYPDARIIFATFAEQKHLVSLCGFADEIIVIDSSSLPRFATSMMGTFWRLWQARVDVCIDLEFFSRFSMIVSCLSGARRRVGFFAFFHVRSPLLTHAVSLNHYTHVSRGFLAMAEALGISVAGDEGVPPVLPSRIEVAGEDLRRVFPGFGRDRYAVINPNSSDLCLLRSWDTRRFAEVIASMLAGFPDLVVVLVGVGSERPTVEAVLAHLRMIEGGRPEPRVIDLAGKTSFDGLLALIEGAALLLSNDSGPAHIAAAYGIPEVVLFGPETPVLYGPFNPKARVVYRPRYCSPCLHAMDNKSFEDCTPALCMEAITVADVMADVRVALAAAGSAHA